MKTKKIKPIMRLSGVFLIFFCLILTITTNIKIQNQTSELKALQKQEKELIKEESELRKEVKKLSNDEYLLKYAREKYMLIGKGENVIKIPNFEK